MKTTEGKMTKPDIINPVVRVFVCFCIYMHVFQTRGGFALHKHMLRNVIEQVCVCVGEGGSGEMFSSHIFTVNCCFGCLNLFFLDVYYSRDQLNLSQGLRCE